MEITERQKLEHIHVKKIYVYDKTTGKMVEKPHENEIQLLEAEGITQYWENLMLYFTIEKYENAALGPEGTPVLQIQGDDPRE